MVEDKYNDNKLVLELGTRFWNDRIGVLAQIELKKKPKLSWIGNCLFVAR